jgi:3',5'-cyclic AMP phosphodiesterase CpdA
MPVHLPPISRRDFLSAAVATGAGLLLPHHLWARAEADPDRWILLSDTHIPDQRDKELRDIRPAANFERARDEYLTAAANAAGLIVSGDLAIHEGLPGDYQLLAELVRPIREAGIPLHLALGNHDHRGNFYDAFPDARPAKEPPVPDKHVSIVQTRHANWFVLDSLVKTLYTPGRLGEVQLQWLARALDAAADRPALIVAHHNPTNATENNPLEDTAALLDVLLPRPQVKAFFFGHSHRWEFAQRDGLHLINLPTLVWVFDGKSPQGWVDARLRADGMDLELHGLDRSHAAHGKITPFPWRTG